MTVAILDASAVIALIMEEPGAEAVKSVLADSALTTVNLAEAVGYFARNGAVEGGNTRVAGGARVGNRAARY